MKNSSHKSEWEPTEAQNRYWASLRGKKGTKAPNWRGDKIGKDAVHTWLEIKYGKAKKCDNPYCEHKSTWFDWALKSGMTYERKRNNFMRLCRSCHRKYDLTPEKREQAIKNLFWFTGKGRIKYGGK